MKEAQKVADEFVNKNKDALALLGLVSIGTGVVEDKNGLFMKFAKYCKANGVSKEEAFKTLAQLLNEANKK